MPVNKKNLIGRLNALWLLVIIVILKLAASWVALNVFSHLTAVSDPFAYVSGDVTNDVFSNRTNVIAYIGSMLGRQFGPLAPHYIFSTVSGACLWIFLLQVPSNYRIYFLFLAFFPTVTMWLGLVTKESIATSAMLLCLAAWARFISGKFDLLAVFWAIVGFTTYAFLRPHFSLGLAYLLVGTYLFRPQPRFHKIRLRLINMRFSRLSNGVIFCLLTCVTAAFLPHFLDGLDRVINLSLSYFGNATGGSVRTNWLPWHQLNDFYENILWLVPTGVIGPLPSEALNGATFFAAFLEGAVIFIMPIIALFTFKLRVKRKPTPELQYLYRLIIFVIFPMIFYLYVIHAPLAAPNSGSAIRYRAGFEYLLTIPISYVSLLIRRTYLDLDLS